MEARRQHGEFKQPRLSARTYWYCPSPCPNIHKRRRRPRRTSTTIGRTTTNRNSYLRVLLRSFEDTAASQVPTDIQHSARRERTREEPTIWCVCRHSAPSRISRTMTISHEEENGIPICLPFAPSSANTFKLEGWEGRCRLRDIT
jgi:hypothetical protein